MDEAVLVEVEEAEEDEVVSEAEEAEAVVVSEVEEVVGEVCLIQ